MTAAGGDPGETPPKGGWEVPDGSYAAPPFEQIPPAYADPATGPTATPSSYPPPGYGPSPGQYGYPPLPDHPAVSTNRTAIASVIASAIWLCGLGSVIGIVLGAVAINQIKRRGQNGYGLAVAGIAIGAAGVVVALVTLTFSPSWN